MMRGGKAMACLALTAFLAAAPGCGSKGKEKGGAAGPQVVRGVTLAQVAASAVADQLEAVGTVRARNSAQIAARIAGTVTALHVREGDRVARGKLLLTLEAAENTAGAAAAVAGMEEARRGVEEAHARKRLADATFERYHRLFVEQAVTRQEFDSRQTEKELADQGVARAEARLAQARENSRAAGTVAGYARVTSPLAGIVTARSVDAGVTVFPGMPLVTVEEEGNYRLEVAAPESLLGKVRPGMTARVAIDGATGDLTGKVAEVVPTADPASRTFTVKLDIAAKGLRSGMYGRASFPVGERQGLLVPKVAVMERGALTAVWVVGGESVARLRLIKAGRQIGDRVEVLSGLSAGERIVIAGVERVVDGARIE